MPDRRHLPDAAKTAAVDGEGICRLGIGRLGRCGRQYSSRYQQNGGDSRGVSQVSIQFWVSGQGRVCPIVFRSESKKPRHIWQAFSRRP